MPKKRANEMGEFYRDLGAAIRVCRLMRGIEQAAVGAALTPRQTRASISNIEGGRQRILAHTLCDIAGVLGVSPAILLRTTRANQLRRPTSGTQTKGGSDDGA